VGVAFLPPFAVVGAGVRMVTVEHETLELRLHVATARRRRPTAAVRALLEIVEDHVQRRDGTLPPERPHQ
jgi:DNA-binding transcriptional LysR family regulator